MTESAYLPTRLANEFSKVLRDWLSNEEMAKVLKRNAKEDNPGVCHSHDFCDANMAMLEAFGNLNLPAPCDLTDDTPEHEAACSLWSEALDIAAKNKFQVVGDGRTFTCSWTNSFCKAGCETHNITFFCDENSYDKDEIAQISELEVGEIWSSKHYGTAHIVHRIT